MRNQIIALSLGLGLVVSSLSGCAFLQNNPEIVKTVLQLGLRVATYALVNEKPGIEPHIRVVASVLKDPQEALSPEQLSIKLHNAIDSNVDDSIYNQALKDLAGDIIAFYADVYNRHKDELSATVFMDLIQAFGTSMESGLSPKTPASRGFYIETPTTRIEVE